MRAQDVFAQYHELKAVGSKDERISIMAPYYRQGQVYHNALICGKLESQLKGHPRSKFKDVMDALGFTPKIMDGFKMYFDPSYEDSHGTDEYGDLVYDKPLKFRMNVV